MNYADYCVAPTLTVKGAMHVLDQVDIKLVFVVDNNKLLASLTDGDIRRYLLKGGSLDDPAIHAANHNPRYANSEKEAARIYHQKDCVAIPILNDQKELLSIYFGQDEKKPKPVLDIEVVINAGGKGTRLEPYTKILPKPLIPVGDTAIVELIMQRFMEYGCDQFSMIVNYKKELMKAYFADCDHQYNINWYNEEKPLGTGGGLCYLKGKIHKTFFFTNCDILLMSDYASIMKMHRESQNAVTMVCAYKNFKIPYGVIEMGMNGAFEGVKEKPEFDFLINTGLYVVEPEVLDDIEDNVSIGFPDVIERQRAKGRKVGVYPISEYDWLDMGQLEELEKMRKRLYGD